LGLTTFVGWLRVAGCAALKPARNERAKAGDETRTRDICLGTELIDASNDSTVWADTYDRDLTDIFAIQSEVSQTIARKLAATLSPEEKKRIETKPTENLEAYDLYLQATKLITEAGVLWYIGDLEKLLHDAIKLLDQAVHLDPNFALAYCAAANAHDMLYFSYDATLERRALGDIAIANALRLQPDLPEAHLAYAYHLHRAYRDYQRARVQLTIARQNMPNSVPAMDLEAGAFDKDTLRYLLWPVKARPVLGSAPQRSALRKVVGRISANGLKKAVDMGMQTSSDSRCAVGGTSC
jgi:tetratricopeptide (TPR) repeat protein